MSKTIEKRISEITYEFSNEFDKNRTNTAKQPLTIMTMIIDLINVILKRVEDEVAMTEYDVNQTSLDEWF